MARPAEVTLKLTSTPAGAEVWIDGKPFGETPLGNLEVPIGTHELLLRHPDVGEHRHVASRRPRLQRLDAVIGGVGGNAEDVELARQHLAIHRMIVHDQHAHAGGSAGTMPNGAREAARAFTLT